MQRIFVYLHGYKVEASSYILIYDANKKSLKILKGVTRKNQRKTDNTMTRRKRTKDIKGGNQNP